MHTIRTLLSKIRNPSSSVFQIKVTLMLKK